MFRSFVVGMISSGKKKSFCLLLLTGASAEEEDELYERGVVESNCVYRLVENRLVPHEQAWASIPCVSLLGSTEVCGLLWILL